VFFHSPPSAKMRLRSRSGAILLIIGIPFVGLLLVGCGGAAGARRCVNS
jgi:hypothetical protein